MKLSWWVATRDRATWITLAEVLVLGLVLLTSSGTAAAWLVGLPLLLHLGYRDLTSLPLGAVPGAPSGNAERRRNHELRAQVVAFLNEVQRAEKYVQSARARGSAPTDVEKSLRWARERLKETAEEVVKATGRAAAA